MTRGAAANVRGGRRGGESALERTGVFAGGIPLASPARRTGSRRLALLPSGGDRRALVDAAHRGAVPRVPGVPPEGLGSGGLAPRGGALGEEAAVKRHGGPVAAAGRERRETRRRAARGEAEGRRGVGMERSRTGFVQPLAKRGGSVKR